MARGLCHLAMARVENGKKLGYRCREGYDGGLTFFLKSYTCNGIDIFGFDKVVLCRTEE